MAAKKRYRSLNTCASVINAILLFVFQKFIFIRKPSRIKSVITEENREQLCLVEEIDLINEPEKYIRLGSSDFLRIYRELNMKPSILDKFQKQDFYFSNEEFQLMKVTRHQRYWRYYICLEQNDYGHWMIHMRERRYVKRPNGHKIICMRK